jgi:hypothetical protein
MGDLHLSGPHGAMIWTNPDILVLPHEGRLERRSSQRGVSLVTIAWYSLVTASLEPTSMHAIA